jgi:ribosomal-protein-alanine N-acetyltransferase
MNIRKMTSSDIKSVAEIEELSFTHPWSEEDISGSYNSDCNIFYISEKENKVVGYIGFTVAADEGYILNVAVNPDCRGQGIGKALVQKAIDYSLEKGLAFLTLEVRESNATAINLYSSLGFERVGVRKNYYTNPKEDALLMTRFFINSTKE